MIPEYSVLAIVLSVLFIAAMTQFAKAVKDWKSRQLVKKVDEYERRRSINGY